MVRNVADTTSAANVAARAYDLVDTIQSIRSDIGEVVLEAERTIDPVNEFPRLLECYENRLKSVAPSTSKSVPTSITVDISQVVGAFIGQKLTNLTIMQPGSHWYVQVYNLNYMHTFMSGVSDDSPFKKNRQIVQNCTFTPFADAPVSKSGVKTFAFYELLNTFAEQDLDGAAKQAAEIFCRTWTSADPPGPMAPDSGFSAEQLGMFYDKLLQLPGAPVPSASNAQVGLFDGMMYCMAMYGKLTLATPFNGGEKNRPPTDFFDKLRFMFSYEPTYMSRPSLGAPFFDAFRKYLKINIASAAKWISHIKVTPPPEFMKQTPAADEQIRIGVYAGTRFFDSWTSMSDSSDVAERLDVIDRSLTPTGTYGFRLFGPNMGYANDAGTSPLTYVEFLSRVKARINATNARTIAALPDTEFGLQDTESGSCLAWAGVNCPSSATADAAADAVFGCTSSKFV